MDPQLLQQLTQVFQQGLQILQQAGGSADSGAADPGAADPSMGDDEDDMNPSAGMDDDDMASDDAMGGGGGNLHDRISQLEQHTGLKKSASNASLVDRLDMLEEHWLGEAYEGSALDRIAQLENAAGLQKSARTSSRKAPVDDAPDVIPLDALIKTAIAEGVKQVLSAQTQDQSALPSINNMRKAAGTVQQPTYGKRKASPTVVQTDADLAKAAKAWGYAEDELDQPVGLGDFLILQYHAAKNGTSLGADD